jgi:hypothetical protein
MLKIRKAQLDAFADAAALQFETSMVGHSLEFAPPLCSVLGPEQTRVAVRRALEQARAHGFTNQGPAKLFVECMLLFGSDFATDPQYPWIIEALADGNPETQKERASRLFVGVGAYQEAVLGPGDEHTLRALQKLRDLAGREFRIRRETLHDNMFRAITQVYPEKAKFAGDQAVANLIASGVETAAACDLPEGRGQVLVVVLMFAFGHGCFADPLYPWIGNTVRDSRIIDAAARAKRLEQKALTWLDRVLVNLAKEKKA